MKEYTIHPLVVGVNETDQGVMTYLRDYGKRIYLPIYVFVIKGGDKNILVDTGLEQFVVADDLGEKLGMDILEFEDALATQGLEPKDIDVIIHTHLHNDHCENDYKCENAKVYVQQAEFDFFQNPHPIDHRYYPDVLDDVDVEIISGDQELFEGISVIFSPGHSVGGQSVCVNTKKGKAVITGFCANEKNFPEAGPAVAPGVHIDVRQAYDSAQKIKNEADILIPLHAMWVGRESVIG
ncbi:beta-lactamase domain protein [Desulfatibacillum aliphaticivorans]|uniref:Beta-lactamase domain protein n=1 Tax=Desulfatibacillum aliphaticivorans TaxID=218208 RepID=B8FN82_DESAL|nr:N-acyl homoserine lactonase family protein [Desulfatibacillum aliphaticivorans]ACL06051.1 beta-lactamase domain protein [Desulfatibacillum aliphaticivorans]